METWVWDLDSSRTYIAKKKKKKKMDSRLLFDLLAYNEAAKKMLKIK